MRYIKVDVSKKRRGEYTLLWTADHHHGSRGTDNSCLELCAARCREVDGWAHGSDAIEAVLPNDRRWRAGSAREKAGTVLEQMMIAKEWNFSANERGNCLGMLEGNHEGAASKLVGPISETIATESKIPFLTQTAYIDLVFVGGTARIFLAHFSPSSYASHPCPQTREATRCRALRSRMHYFDAHLHLSAHTHRWTCAPPTREDHLSVEAGKLAEVRSVVDGSWYVVCPGMLAGYQEHYDYIQEKLLPPTSIGWAEIDFDVKSARVLRVRRIGGDGKPKPESTVSLEV